MGPWQYSKAWPKDVSNCPVNISAQQHHNATHRAHQLQLRPISILNFDSPSITLMRSIFDALGRALVTVNHDLAQTSTDGQRTPNPSAAFLAFFNSAGSVPYVASVFNNATAGVSLLDPTPYSATGAPTFFSVTARGQMSANVNNQMVDAWDNCNSNSALTAFYLNVETYPVPYIALCPLFFTAQPPVIFGDTPPASVSGQPASNCLRINTSINRFQYTGSGNTKPLTQYRTWILLEEIVHYYTSITLSVTSDVSDANKAFRLSTGASLPNAPSYLYYAASG